MPFNKSWCDHNESLVDWLVVDVFWITFIGMVYGGEIYCIFKLLMALIPDERKLFHIDLFCKFDLIYSIGFEGASHSRNQLRNIIPLNAYLLILLLESIQMIKLWSYSPRLLVKRTASKMITISCMVRRIGRTNQTDKHSAKR